MSAKPLPEGAPRVIPMLVCRDPGAEADFCKAAFRAEERVRRPAPTQRGACVGDHRDGYGHD
jgi:hypothetical protein